MREETYFPPFLTHRQRAETALISVVQRAYINGISTRNIDALAQELVSRISTKARYRACVHRSTNIFTPFGRAASISPCRICFSMQPPNHRIVSHAVFVAVGIDAEGTRRILDVMVSADEDFSSWECFLHRLVDRGLHGVQLVTSDAHKGLQAAIQTVCVGSSWQRCTIHVMRNVLSHISHRDKRAVAALCRTILAQTTHADAQRQLAAVLPDLERHWGKQVGAVLQNTEESLFAYLAFPIAHHLRIRTTNIVERVNREMKRRTRVVSVFPDAESVLRLVGIEAIE